MWSPFSDEHVAHEAFVIHVVLNNLDHALFVEWGALCGEDRRNSENQGEEDERRAQGQSTSPPMRYAADTESKAP